MQQGQEFLVRPVNEFDGKPCLLRGIAALKSAERRLMHVITPRWDLNPMTTERKVEEPFHLVEDWRRQDMSFEAADFRATMAHFATGVTVVTTALGQACFGLTVNAFSSVSLNPPLILVSLDLKSQTYTMIRQSSVFAVNILTKGQQQLARRFASKDLQSKTFDDIPLVMGETKTPLFQEALAWIECRVAQEYAGGDHVLVLGEVLNIEYHGEQHEPLLYYRSSFWAIQQGELAGSQSATEGKAVSGHGVEGRPVVAASTLLLKELLPVTHLFSFEA